MTHLLQGNTSDTETTDWLDELLRSVAVRPEPDDAGFSDAVLQALPPQATNRQAKRIHWINVCALASGSAVLALLLPDGVDVLASLSTGQPATSQSLEHLVPTIALLAWLAWWSLQQSFAD